MAVFPPDLGDSERRVLKIILDYKIVRGSEIMRNLGFTEPDQLVAPIDELLKLRLIEVTGDLSPANIPFATFGTPPSAQEYLRALVQRR